MSCIACECYATRITNIFRDEELKEKYFYLTGLKVKSETCDKNFHRILNLWILVEISILILFAFRCSAIASFAMSATRSWNRFITLKISVLRSTESYIRIMLIRPRRLKRKIRFLFWATRTKLKAKVSLKSLW